MMKLVKIWLIVVFSLFLVGTITGYYIYKYDQEENLDKLKLHVGETFDTSILKDTAGNKVNIAFKTETAIINFWFRGCTPCINTMKKYKELLGDNPNEITFISISKDNPKYWKTLFNKDSPIEFLRNNHPNWLHYCVSADSINSGDLLVEKYGISQYPSYIVIDKNLKIVEVPFNLTWYVKSTYHSSPKYFLFLKDQIIGFDKSRKITIAGLVTVSLLYWGIVTLVWIGGRVLRKKR